LTEGRADFRQMQQGVSILRARTQAEEIPMPMKLLVVDDEAPVVEVLKAFLKPSGSDVVGLTDSLKAAEWVEREKFDGIILDVRMPDLDGFELTRRARASFLNSKTPVAMLTGLDDVETMRRGFRAGVTCFLGKPITRARVASVVSAMRGAIVMERRRSVRLPYRTKVECLAGSCLEKRFIAESLDIGEGGMLIQPSGGLALGDQFNLKFQIPTSRDLLRMQARVVRLGPPDSVATEFLDSTIRDKTAIRDYMIWEAARVARPA
jgi:CheY-like chemotaxis protein